MNLRLDATQGLRRITAFMQAIPQATAEGVDESATAIEQDARDNSPVETGSMRDGWFRETALTHGFTQAAAAAQGANPKAVIVAPPVLTGKSGAVVGNATAHAALVEYGTHTMPARPVLRNAVERERPQFAGRIKQRIAKAAKAI